MQQIQADVEQIKRALLQQNTYKQLYLYLELVRKKDMYTISLCLRAIKEVMQDQTSQPISKVLAARFAKELMELHDEVIVDLFAQSMLDLYSDIGAFQMENPDVDRGKYYFSNNPDEDQRKLGNTYLRLVLECILVWHLWYPLDDCNEPTQFKLTYDTLVKKGVKFPKLNYFKIEDVKTYYFNTAKSLKRSAVFAQTNQEDCQETFQRNLQLLANIKSVGEIETLISYYENFFKENMNQFEYSMIFFCQRLLDLHTKYNRGHLMESEYLQHVHNIVQNQLDHQERQKASFSQLLMQTPDRESNQSRPFDDKSLHFVFKDSSEFSQKSLCNKDEQNIILAQKDAEIETLQGDTMILRDQVDQFQDQVKLLSEQIQAMEDKIAQQTSQKHSLKQSSMASVDKPQRLAPTSTLQKKYIDDE